MPALAALLLWPNEGSVRQVVECAAPPACQRGFVGAPHRRRLGSQLIQPDLNAPGKLAPDHRRVRYLDAERLIHSMECDASYARTALTWKQMSRAVVAPRQGNAKLALTRRLAFLPFTSVR